MQGFINPQWLTQFFKCQAIDLSTVKTSHWENLLPMRKNHAVQHDCNEKERYALLCSLLLFYWQLLKRIMLKGNPGLDGNKPGQTSLSSFWMSDKIVTPLPAEMPGQHIWELYRQQQMNNWKGKAKENESCDELVIVLFIIVTIDSLYLATA